VAALPYMPLYVADYLADAAHLSTLGHGAYLLLIMTYWQRGEALPSDDRKLARITRLSDAEWAELRADMAEFFTEEDGRWKHKRIDRELTSVNAKIEQTRNAGKASAQRRLNGRSTPVPTDAQRTFNDTDTDTDTDTDKEEKKDGGKPPIDPSKALWNAGHKLLIGSGISDNTARGMLGKWRREHGDELLAVALGKAQREGAIDPVSFIQGCFRTRSRDGPVLTSLAETRPAI
jgi:uncharacterized protein YdaU (DUF1376 family)